MSDPRLRVVIADDQPGVLDIIKRILQPEFEVVRAVFDGKELVQAVRDERPAVVVTDVSMPEMTGIEALRALQAADEAPPTVMLSAHNDPRLVANALGEGASAYVIKRRAPLDLKPAVEAALDGRRFISKGLKSESTRIGERMNPTRLPDDETASAKITRRIEELGDWRGETLAHVRRLIHDADPDIEEEWKWRGTPVWSHDGIVCTGESYKQIVKLTFARGASLDDPQKLFNASLEGNTRRAIDIREGEALDEAAFQRLTQAAVAANAAARAKREYKKR